MPGRTARGKPRATSAAAQPSRRARVSWQERSARRAELLFGRRTEEPSRRYRIGARPELVGELYRDPACLVALRAVAREVRNDRRRQGIDSATRLLRRRAQNGWAHHRDLL